MPNYGLSQAERNKAVIRSLYSVCLNGGDDARAAEFIAPDFTSPTAKGVDGFIRLAQALRRAFADLHFETSDLFAEGERVAVRWHMTGTHVGAWLGLAPTGKAVRQSANVLYALRDGKVIEALPQTDSLGLLIQLGAVDPKRFHLAPHTAVDR